MYLRCKTAN